jgi:hypothetical protein
MTTKSSDPDILADDLCEILDEDTEPAKPDTLADMLRDADDCADAALVQVASRGKLSDLVAADCLRANSPLLSALCETLETPNTYFLVVHELCQQKNRDVRRLLEALLLSAEDALPELFALIIDQGMYEVLLSALDVRRHGDTETLRALASARPTYDMDELNEDTLTRLRELSFSCPYDLLIVPGFTPVGTKKPTPLHELPAAVARVQLAAKDLLSGLAPAVFVTGGSVHPPGTPYNEALMMRKALLDLGVPADQILVDPHARHSTTNLRNAGRVLLSLSRDKALIVTGFESVVFSQAFYFAHDGLSTFALRCKMELGYSVGTLEEVDSHHIAYQPSSNVQTPNVSYPLDA